MIKVHYPTYNTLPRSTPIHAKLHVVSPPKSNIIYDSLPERGGAAYEDANICFFGRFLHFGVTSGLSLDSVKNLGKIGPPAGCSHDGVSFKQGFRVDKQRIPYGERFHLLGYIL